MVQPHPLTSSETATSPAWVPAENPHFSLAFTRLRRGGFLLLPLLAAGMAALLLLQALTLSAAPASPQTTFTVNSPLDQVDAAINGICASASGLCTLRAAVQEANAGNEPAAIFLPAGHYTLTIPGPNEDNAATGDLDTEQDIFIEGTGDTPPVIHADELDRVFHIHAGTLELRRLVVSGGFPGNEQKGGGIYNDSSLILSRTVVAHNRTSGFRSGGGGIYSHGPLLVLESQVIDNIVYGQETHGGGIESRHLMTLTGSHIGGNHIGGTWPFGGGLYLSSRGYLSDTTIAGNTTDGWNSDGGGIYVGSTSLTILSSTIRDNRTAIDSGGGNGGGLYKYLSGRVVIEDSLFAGNVADGIGGAIHTRAHLLISNTTFLSNAALASGAIEQFDGNGRIWHSQFLSNTVSGSGGAIGLDNQYQMQIIDSEFYYNRANSAGAVYASGFLTVISSTFSHNHANYRGGAIHVILGSLSLQNSAVFSNTAQWGGGLDLAPTSYITNTTISGNRATHHGGGILFDLWANEPLYLRNVTLVNNVADSDGDGEGNGGGMYVYLQGVYVQNSLIAGNADLSPGTQAPDCFGVIDSTGYNLLGNDHNCTFNAGSGDQVGTAANPIDPLLGPLRDNGGGTWTHAPALASPAINAGHPDPPGSGGGACAARDQRGVARPQAGGCDIGAHEQVMSLYLGKSGPALAASGTPITYTLHLTNHTLITQTNIVLTDALPLGSSYLGGGTLVGNHVSWTMPSLASGEVVTAQFAVSATDTITNHAYRVSASQGYSATGHLPVVTVVAVPITGLAAGNSSPTPLGQPTTLTAVIASGGHVTYAWDLGDGQVATGAIVSHTYALSGSYTAVVSASNVLGTVTATTAVVIVPPPILPVTTLYLPAIHKP